MLHRVTNPFNPSSAHSLRVVELAIASVWVSFILQAAAQEMREVFNQWMPASPAAR